MSLLRKLPPFPEPRSYKDVAPPELKASPETRSKTERSQRKNKNSERDAIDAEEPPPPGLKPT